MPVTNNNTCRLVAQNIAALSAVAAGDVHRLSYTGTDGIALHVRARNIGGDPHNYSIYEKLGMTPKDAFDHAARAFGYEPTNRNTTGVKKGIASGTWGTCATPHWAEGDFAAAHRLLMSLAALSTNGRAYAPVATIWSVAEGIFAKLPNTNAFGTTSKSVIVREIAWAIRSYKPGYRLANGPGHIGGLAYSVGGSMGDHYLVPQAGGFNGAILSAAGIPVDSRTSVLTAFSGGPVKVGDFPTTPNISRVERMLRANASEFPLRGVLLIAGLNTAQQIVASKLISELDGTFYGAALGDRGDAVASSQLRAQLATLAPNRA